MKQAIQNPRFSHSSDLIRASQLVDFLLRMIGNLSLLLKFFFFLQSAVINYIYIIDSQGLKFEMSHASENTRSALAP